MRGLVRGVIWLLGLLLVRPFTLLVYLTRPRNRRLPPITNPILKMHASDIAAAVRSRKVRDRRRLCVKGVTFSSHFFLEICKANF